ncbi:MAG: ATP-grasp domain-containing protein [Leptolyngbya sp. IPPAS B-1204]|nr:MAG: ATP-grasp enzyme [Leptolyngbya sp. IPPAS B-1204]
MAQSSFGSFLNIPTAFPSRVNIQVILQNLGTLVLLSIALPLNAAFVFLTSIGNLFTELSQPRIAQPKTVLISGGKMTKALQLARSFHAAGHRVILVETHKYWLTGHRFSKAVNRFYTVPTPQDSADAYTQALLEIVQREQVDVYVPVCSPVASYYDALAEAALSPYCEVFHTDAETVKALDHKYSFNQLAQSLSLSVPKSFYITAPEQVLQFDFSQETRSYILKSIAYNSVYRLNLTRLPCPSYEDMKAFVYSLPISSENPWIMQEFIAGQEFCTHSTVRNGELRLHCCCESSAFQVNYQHVENPAILDWVQQFVKGLNLTGQFSFDFIQTADGPIYAIECNPRTHSAITMFYNHPGVADAYLDTVPLPEPMQPLPTSKPTYWLYHELWRFTGIRSLSDLRTRLQTLFQGTDAIYQVDDPLPFLMVHHWHIPLLLLKNLEQMKGWVRIDFNIGKLVELDGD